MPGGEYLAAEALSGIWHAMDEWVRQTIDTAGGLTSFLRAFRPRALPQCLNHVPFPRSHETDNHGTLRRTP